MLSALARLLQIPVSRVQSLLYAVPFLGFTVPGIIAIARNADGPTLWFFLAVDIAFSVTYIACWTLNDPAPTVSRTPPRLIACLATLLALSAVGTWCFAAPQSTFWIVYLAPACGLLLPRRRMVPGFSLVTALAFAFTIPAFYPYPDIMWVNVGSYVGTSVFILLIRHSINADIDAERRQRAQHMRELRAERERMASDLHDCLGQTLTAISTMSQLTARMIENGQDAKAREAALAVADLSREALTQTRAIVRARQTLDLGEEVERARVLLENTGAEVRVEGDPAGFAPSFAEARDLAAHVIREGAANILHHAHPSECVMRFSPEHVEIENDGVREARADTDRKGSGIEALRARADGLGTLEATQSRQRWRLAFILEAGGAKG